MAPTPDPLSKKVRVKQMFDNIAYRYDFLNHFLSLGIDRYWRRIVLRLSGDKHPVAILDVATGTADLAITLAATGAKSITGVDISTEMLKIGREKVRKAGLSKLITLEEGDSEALPFSAERFDLVTAAFGVRNFENLDQGLQEMYRVLKNDGQVIILEFSQVSGFPWKQVFRIYFHYVLPLAGRLISKHESAYTYLPESVSEFPSGDDFLARLQKAGFINTRSRRLSGGIASIYIGEKK
jgi:demethylmenaquinone methyltransferase / 2-methoxy-6-polyprenyl-1,4-benzoquinol methylase